MIMMSRRWYIHNSRCWEPASHASYTGRVFWKHHAGKSELRVLQRIRSEQGTMDHQRLTGAVCPEQQARALTSAWLHFP
jgi:hypothetical protein